MREKRSTRHEEKQQGVAKRLPHLRHEGILLMFGTLISLSLSGSFVAFSFFSQDASVSHQDNKNALSMFPGASVPVQYRRVCSTFHVSSEGKWYQNHTGHLKVWIWKEPDGKFYETSSTEQVISSTTTSLSTLLQRRNTSLILYGSSHLRELYFSLVRLEQGLPYDSKLPDNITYLPSGTRYQSKECDPTRRGWVTGLLGVDLKKCGLPGRRIIPELGDRVAIGFKTFLHTPDADAQFLDFLSEHMLRKPDILVVDVGIWGTRGDKMGGMVDYELTPEQELDYYLDWIQTSFPTSKVVFLYEELKLFPSLQERLLRKIQNMTASSLGSIFLFRKDYMVRDKPRRMPCGHGCAGPVMNTVSLLVLEWLEKILAERNPCVSAS